jgi:hypothetical protein
MNILTTENLSFSMNDMPDEIDDMQYGVLDYSAPMNVDYHFVPMVFMESFNAPAAVLRIGEYKIQMPLDWSVIIGDPECGEPEIIPLMTINDRGFHAFVFNPITGTMPKFDTIDLLTVYTEVKWYFPKLKNGHILAVPLTDGHNPLCAYFVKDTTKVPEVLALHNMV